MPIQDEFFLVLLAQLSTEMLEEDLITVAVELVTHQWTTDRGHVDPELMGAASPRMQFDERILTGSTQEAITSQGRLTGAVTSRFQPQTN